MEIKKFYATWCAQCAPLGKRLEEVAEELGVADKVKSYDIDKDEVIADAHRITSLPTIIITKNSTEVARLLGNVSKKEIEEAIKKNM